MKARAIVTLSNENAPAAPGHQYTRRPANAAVGAAHGRQPGCVARPSSASDEPAVLGLCAYRVDLTRRRNNRSPEREE
jgi:hypothetical protein